MTTLEITRHCPMCGKATVMTVDEERYLRWRQGALIQRVFRELTPQEREILMTGIDAECWETLRDEDDE